jgi:hypothetical protein
MTKKQKRKRLSLVITTDLYKFTKNFADEQGCTVTEVIRRGLSIMEAFTQQRAVGRCHLGFVTDRTKLDAEVIGLFNTK